MHLTYITVGFQVIKQVQSTKVDYVNVCVRSGGDVEESGNRLG